MVDVAEALRMPAMVVESGPAAGVVAAQLAGAQLGLANLISFDMGGTTAKASLIAGGEITVTAEYEVGGGAGASAGCTVPATRCGFRSSISPRSAPAAAASPGSIPAAR